MRLFRIAIGYRTAHRQSEPAVLAFGYDQAVLQKAIDTAPPEFVRFETGSFHFLRTARRALGAVPQNTAIEAPVPVSQPAAGANPEPGQAPAPESIETSGAEAGENGPEGEGQSLAEADEPAPKTHKK
jgi:hypothetical protein